MPNIRLTNEYKWTTDGIYDTTQAKTQNVINSEIADVAQNNANLVLMQSTQPTATGNKIWIKEGVSYQIPVVEDLADAFDATVTYSVGQLCTYEGSVYRCTTSHTGAWDATHFSLTKLGSEIDSLKAVDASLQGSLNSVEDDVTKLKENLATVETGNTASRAYSVNEYVVVGGILYKVTSAIASGGTFTVGTNIKLTTISDAIRNDIVSDFWYIPMEIWDYQTLINSYQETDYETNTFYARCMNIGKSVWMIAVYLSSIPLTNISAMLQLKFPGYLKDNAFGVVIGGMAYIGVQPLTAIQGTGVGVYFRPNVSGSLGESSGVLSCLLFVRH